MDIEKYISSGILEAYALGDVTPAEKAEVEEMISRYPEVRAELALIEETMEAVAFRASVAPKEDLKNKVLSKALGQEGSTLTARAEEGGKVVPLQTPAVERKKDRPAVYRYYLAAAITLAVVSSVAAFYFFTKWQDAEDRLFVAVTERTALAQQFRTVENRLDSVNRELAVYSNEQYTEIELQGLAIAPEAGATVLWNPVTREVFLNPSDLPATPADKQYQLWAIVDGQPVDLGVLTAERNGGLLKMKGIENASAFAITLEPAGGSPSPTLDQMYVMGKAS